jgi:hypothetical protein
MHLAAAPPSDLGGLRVGSSKKKQTKKKKNEKPALQDQRFSFFFFSSSASLRVALEDILLFRRTP